MNGGCPICKRDDVAVLNRLLARGRSPRGIAQGARGLNRKQLTRHRDRCLGETADSVGDLPHEGGEA